MADSNVPPVALDPNTSAAQSGAMSGTQGLGQWTGLTQSPFFSQQGTTANFGGSALTGAMAGGGAMQGVGGAALGNSAEMAQLYPTLLPFAGQALQTGFDPERQLYDQMHQQNTDATNANISQRGLQYSPWGAGVANTSDQQFNTNWLQTQLGREQTGAGTADALLTQGIGGGTSAAALGGQGANFLASGGAMPYMTGTGINQDLSKFVPFLTSNQQQQIGDFLGYYGQSNANTANAINAGAARDKADQALGTGIGSALGNVFQGSGKLLFA
jgi:hypothetical protein